MLWTRSVVLVAVALVAVTLLLFAPTCASDFVNYDDPEYVSQNPHVQAGLSWAGTAWAFTTTHAGNWHPLTWLSLQLDASLYGPKPAWGYHLTNILLHAVSTVLLFLALRHLTGALWRPALVAALFAVHPLHVESVAWVAERKDVLSGLFWMLTLLAYAHYAERPTRRRFLAVPAAFGLGLMAKPMLVTLPCVLLLIDYWPLGRMAGLRPAAKQVLEKLPLFALTVVACLVTVYAQQAGGSLRTFLDVPFTDRLGNALLAYCGYLFKAVWPADLSVFYPYPAHLSGWQVVAAALLLATVSVVVVGLRRRCPYLLVGWLWFLGTLVPVIGLVQVGAQAMADRYTYLPSVGLFVAVAWGGAALLARWPIGASLLAGAGLAVLVVISLSQVLVWQDSITLWKHARAVTPANAIIENNLGTTLEERGEFVKAGQHFAEAVRLDPDYLVARHNHAGALARQGELQEAARQYEEVLRVAPDYPSAHFNYALLLRHTGQAARAAEQFRLAGQALAREGEADGAAECFRLADALEPCPD